MEKENTWTFKNEEIYQKKVEEFQTKLYDNDLTYFNVYIRYCHEFPESKFCKHLKDNLPIGQDDIPTMRKIAKDYHKQIS